MKSLVSRFINKIEFERISRFKRHKRGSTVLFGKKIDFVDSVTFLHGYNEIFTDEIYKFKSNVTSPLIIDCGSNIGLSIIFYKKLFPNSKVIGFEPDPEIFEVLKSNIEALGYKNIELHNFAIWKEDKMMDFRSEGGYSGRLVLPSDNSTYKVKATKLSNFIGSQQVDFLKLDIEGAELDVVSSIEKQLNMVNNLFIEYHAPSKESQKLSALLSVLEENGFRYYIKEAYSPKNPFLEVNDLDGMDLQLNISCIRK